jgi:hypothetical protein
MRRVLRLAAVGVAVLCAACLPALAQTGGMTVSVTDAASGAPLPGVEVVLTSATRQVAPTRAVTDARGRAEFPVLRAGSGYAVEVRLAGYAPVRMPDLRVQPGKATALPVGLFPELRETVGVTAEREGVDLEDTAAGTTFSGRFTEDLPLRGRFYQTLLTLAPGVLDSDEDGNPNVHGSRATDFKTQVGGVANTDPLTGGFMSYVNLESVEALEIVTAGAGVEFGRAQGGFANILQKQGSDSFEGVAGVLWNTSRLDGNGAADVPVPAYDWVQPFVQLSGPILKERLWYRLSHEWIDREDPIFLLNQVAVIRKRQGIHSDQVTWQASPRNKLALQHQSDPMTLDNVGISSLVPPESGRTFRRGGTTTSLAWTAPHSARLFVESLAAWQDHREETFPTAPGTSNECLVSFEFPDLEQGLCEDVETGIVSGAFPTDSRDRRQRWTVRTQATLWLPSRGRVGHRLKGGLSVENERYFRRMFRGTSIDLVTPGPFQGSTATAFTQVHVPETSSSRAVGTSVGIFLEDQVRIGSRWSATAGLRLDLEDIGARALAPFDPAAESRLFLELVDRGEYPIFAMGQAFTGFENSADFLAGLAQVLGASPGDLPPLTPLLDDSNGWHRKRKLENLQLRNTLLSPRLAVAWDPLGDGRTKLAATAGRYYDKVFLSVPLLGVEPATTTIPFVAEETGFGWLVTRTNGGVEPNARVTMVDPGLRTPYQDELTLSLERELRSETSVKLTWVRRRFRDQLQDVDLNHVAADYGRCRRPSDLGSQLLVPSAGSGQTIVDPYTGESYVDTDPGWGDGRIDDCTGTLAQPGGVLAPRVLLPDGLPDLYTLNPVWGQVMLVTNANTADYSGLVLELIRRRADGWEMQASYTWSRAIGDAEQFDQLLGDDSSIVGEERGFLGYDQRHVVKVVGAVDTRWGFRLGTAVRWESGLPYSLVEPTLAYYGVNPRYGISDPDPQFRYRYSTSRRNDHRNPGFWTFDARLARELALPGGRTAGVTVEVFNLLNDDTLRILEVRGGEVEAVRRFGRRFQVGLRSSF